MQKIKMEVEEAKNIQEENVVFKCTPEWCEVH